MQAAVMREVASAQGCAGGALLREHMAAVGVAGRGDEAKLIRKMACVKVGASRQMRCVLHNAGGNGTRVEQNTSTGLHSCAGVR